MAKDLRQRCEQSLSGLLRDSNHLDYYSAVCLDAGITHPACDPRQLASESIKRENRYEFQHDEMGYARVVCEDTLEPLFDIIHSVAFFDHISTVSCPIVHIISKVVKNKCRIRKSPDVWDRKFNIPENLAKKYKLAQKESVKKMYKRMIDKRTGIRPKLCNWVCCSLLGNYQHVDPNTRPNNTEKRKLIYNIFNSDIYPEFTATLMKRCGNLFNFAIREYMVYCVESMSAFHEELSKLFDWNDFRTKVINAMSEYRMWFFNNNEINTKDNNDGSVINVPSNFFEFTCQHFKTAHESLHHYHASMFTVSCILKKKRPDIPLVELPQEIKDEDQKIDIEKTMLEIFDYQEQDNGEDEEEEEEEGWSDDDTIDLTEPMAYKTRHLKAIDARDQERDVASERKVRGIVFSKYMPPLHIQVMNEMVKKHIYLHYRDLKPHPYVPTDTLFFVITYLRLFGIDKPTAARSLRLMKLIQAGKLSDFRKVVLLTNLRNTAPYAYTLIQCCIEMIDRNLEIVVVAELPEHYWHNQIKAIQARFPWTITTNSLPIHPTFFYFCRHCKSVCVSLSRFDNTNTTSTSTTTTTSATHENGGGEQQQSTTKKKTQKAIVSSFLKMDGNIMDNTTNTKWCRENRGTRFKECKIDPLCCPSLLGRIIKYKRELICLCTKCGFCMSYIPTRCAVTSTGIVCAKCTAIEENKRYIDKYHLMLQLGYPEGQETASCAICPKSTLRKTSSIYLYPFNVLLCSKCSSNWLARAVDNAVGTKVNNKEELVKFIVDFIKARNIKRENFKCNRLSRYGGMTRNRWMSQTSRLGEEVDE